jgi:hypothetical protein
VDVIYELEPVDTDEDEISDVDRAFVSGVLKGSTSERLAILRFIGRLQRQHILSHYDATTLQDAIRAGEHQVDP